MSADILTSDLDGTTAEQVAALHASGRWAVCHVSAGSCERWRQDASASPEDVRGERLDGLENDVAQIPDLVASFDFAANESCLVCHECGAYRPFADGGKPVLHVEHADSASFCSEPSIAGSGSIAKAVELDAWRDSC
ncbi:hypothetical protein M2316_000275 [Cellulosimicrobium cellulans]|nr:hypothetical protein [Cellulosimicrobium cellulans]